jgi:uncharacterized membrane protein YgdD (TMEM256/DUF423 family)
MNKKIIITGSIFGMIAIILGAFGAHALKNKLSIAELTTFETGVRYQMYHALFLLLLTTIPDLSQKTKQSVYYLVLLGVLLFSGSIYLLATNRLTTFDFKIIGPLTPVGGILLVAAWMLIIINFLKKKL